MLRLWFSTSSSLGFLVQERMIQPCGTPSKISRCCAMTGTSSSLAWLTALPIARERDVGSNAGETFSGTTPPADRFGESTRVLRLKLRVGRLIEVIAGGQAMWVAIADRPDEIL
jgi:hypothetical protein